MTQDFNSRHDMSESAAGLKMFSERMAPRRRIFIVHGSQYLTDHAFSGDGLVAWGFINELALRGHRINVATDRLDVKAVSPANLTLTEFPRTHRNKFVAHLSYIQKVRAYFNRVLKTEGIDVAHQMNPVVRGISLSVLGKRVPLVLGTYVGDWKQTRVASGNLPRAVNKRIGAMVEIGVDIVQQHFASSLVLSTPHALKRVALSLDVGDRIEFLHHGVDVELFNPKPRAEDPVSCDGQIVYVGLVEPHKGVLTLADAFARVAHSLTWASLVVVGDGSLMRAMKERLSNLGVIGRAMFVGRASRSEVAAWMRSSSVVCAPSFGEPYGQNILEAMASARPVVKTVAGGHRYLGDTIGTVSVEPGNVDQLARALSYILSNRELAREMGNHNRRIAEERHAWPRVTTGLEDIYERAITRCALRRGLP